MITLVLVYVGSVLVKWGIEALDHVATDKATREAGFKGWWELQKYDLMKKALIHVMLCPAWVSGLAMAAVNAVAAQAGLGAMEAVTPISTLLAASMLDSYGKPFAKRLKRASEAE